MSKRIFLLRGLPGSGKSTWARHYQLEHPDVVRVNKDDLRAMLHNGKHSKSRENFVLATRDFIVDQALANSHDVIVDDTNFHPRHRQRLEEIAARHHAIIEIKDFTDVPLEDCIARDLRRPNSVGERVIRQMYSQYVEPEIVKPVYDPSLPDCVICDLDGTLALFGDANPYDRDFTQDAINRAVKILLKRYESVQVTLIFLSGRREQYRDQTQQWLEVNELPTTHLYMRPDGDSRKDVIVKEELYTKYILGKYNISIVIDDRLQVCRLWHRLGLPLFRVGDPDADF